MTGYAKHIVLREKKGGNYVRLIILCKNLCLLLIKTNMKLKRHC